MYGRRAADKSNTLNNYKLWVFTFGLPSTKMTDYSVTSPLTVAANLLLHGILPGHSILTEVMANPEFTRLFKTFIDDTVHLVHNNFDWDKFSLYL